MDSISSAAKLALSAAGALAMLLLTIIVTQIVEQGARLGELEARVLVLEHRLGSPPPTPYGGHP